MGLIIILGIIIGACSTFTFKTYTEETVNNEKVELDTNPVDKKSQNSEAKTENNMTPGGDWKAKIKKVSKMDTTENGKFNVIDQYAYKYKPSNKEVSEFTTYILDQYTSGKYLKNISNDKKMLENIFKSRVVNHYYKDDQEKPYGDFAFDFYQNSKNVYRGINTIGSEPVIANERQMDKALGRIENKE